tara:strand:- start:580 stop:918 length:339 start_codon:yes stop_codon:yes gene_type:complete
MNEVAITIILVLSILLNVLCGIYIRWLLKNFNFLSENVKNILETVETFSNHLSAIYELETFYGDETLQNLLAHSKQVVNEIKVYEDVYTLTSDDIDIEDLFNDEEEKKEEED